jgi:hypothetical protein
MKHKPQTYPLNITRTLGKTAAPFKTLTLAAAVGALLSAPGLFGVEVDLTAVGSNPQALPADFGGNGLVANFHSHPSGTGVFDPFLTLERTAAGGNPAGKERAYNTDGHSALYLDQQRPAWNTYLHLGDLAVVTVNGGRYYAFELDANEPGNNKSLISVDNVRIYTSTADNTGLVQNNEANLDSLGTLRWAMNTPLKNGNNYDADNWIKLDSNLSDELKKANGGSGYSDLILYVPTSAFNGVSANDFLWFYNLNGVHDVAEAGYEEWRAALGRSAPTVPDGGSTMTLLGSALGALGLMAHKRKLVSRA